MAFGIQRKPLDNVEYSDADLAAMHSYQGAPSTDAPINIDWSQGNPNQADTALAREGDASQYRNQDTGSGSGPREGSVGQAPPQMPTMMPQETPRVEYGGAPSPPPPPPSTGGPMGAPGPSTATPSMSTEPSPVAGQAPNPEVAASGPAAPPMLPPSFTPMEAPLGGQQIAQAAYPIERQDPNYGGWGGASDASASYPITRRSIGPGPMTGGMSTQGPRMLGAAGGLLGGGLGVPGLMGGSTQEHTDIGNLIANLYRIANQNTQG